MIEDELRAELHKLKEYFQSVDRKVQHLDPKTDAVLAHLVKSKYTLCWIAGLVFLNTAFSVWIGLKL